LCRCLPESCCVFKQALLTHDYWKECKIACHVQSNLLAFVFEMGCIEKAKKTGAQTYILALWFWTSDWESHFFQIFIQSVLEQFYKYKIYLQWRDPQGPTRQQTCKSLWSVLFAHFQMRDWFNLNQNHFILNWNHFYLNQG
jgi:hypothetical protein